MTEFVKESLSGIKHQFHLLVPEFEEAVVRVLMIGAKKYAPDNWKRAAYDVAVREYTNAIRRHLSAICKGEPRDGETGELHAAHIACSAMFLWWHQGMRGL